MCWGWRSPTAAFNCSSRSIRHSCRVSKTSRSIPSSLAFTLAISLAAGLLFGLIPIVKYANPNLGNALKEGGRGSSDGRERHRARNTLVVAQVALALVLLVASGLDDSHLRRDARRRRRASPIPQEILTFRVAIPTAIVKDAPQVASMHEQILRRIEALPGMTSASLSSSVTMDGNDSNDPIFRRGQADCPRGRWRRCAATSGFPANYFKTMGRPLLAGRDITWADVHGMAPVAMITESLAREFYGEPAGGDRPAHSQHAKADVARNRRRRRRRIRRRRDAAGDDDRLLADDDARLLGGQASWRSAAWRT